MRKLVVIAIIALFPVQGLAWGLKGHVTINRLAAQSFPADMPAFTRTAAAIDEIATLGPEEDRLKGAGKSWDSDNDPGHYLDLGDDGTIDGVSLTALPDDMSDFAVALEAAHSTPWRTGYLPYSIMDGFEQLRQDFAYWRVDTYGAQHASDPALRARFAADGDLREILTIRDLGVWGHFVGDGSQPLHVTVHFNGWGNYPNPHNYTQEHIHSAFESEFVDRYVTTADVEAELNPTESPVPDHLLSQGEIATMTATYLEGTAAGVDPLYGLWAAGGFASGSRDAVVFTAKQLARGADELRNLSVLAWRDSLYTSIGYPSESVQQILDGKVPLTEALLGTV